MEKPDGRAGEEDSEWGLPDGDPRTATEAIRRAEAVASSRFYEIEHEQRKNGWTLTANIGFLQVWQKDGQYKAVSIGKEWLI